MSGKKSDSGRNLCKQWNVQARGYYDKNGQWYMVPISYPAALCDPKGYVYFKTEEDLEKCRSIDKGVTIHVRPNISKLPS